MKEREGKKTIGGGGGERTELPRRKLVIPVGEANGQRKRQMSPRAHRAARYIFYLVTETCAAFFESDERKDLPFRVTMYICYNCVGSEDFSHRGERDEARGRSSRDERENLLRFSAENSSSATNESLPLLAFHSVYQSDKSLSANCCWGRLIRHAKRRGSDLNLKRSFPLVT